MSSNSETSSSTTETTTTGSSTFSATVTSSSATSSSTTSSSATSSSATGTSTVTSSSATSTTSLHTTTGSTTTGTTTASSLTQTSETVTSTSTVTTLSATSSASTSTGTSATETSTFTAAPVTIGGSLSFTVDDAVGLVTSTGAASLMASVIAEVAGVPASLVDASLSVGDGRRLPPDAGWAAPAGPRALTAGSVSVDYLITLPAGGQAGAADSVVAALDAATADQWAVALADSFGDLFSFSEVVALVQVVTLTATTTSATSTSASTTTPPMIILSVEPGVLVPCSALLAKATAPLAAESIAWECSPTSAALCAELQRAAGAAGALPEELIITEVSMAGIASNTSGAQSIELAVTAFGAGGEVAGKGYGSLLFLANETLVLKAVPGPTEFSEASGDVEVSVEVEDCGTVDIDHNTLSIEWSYQTSAGWAPLQSSPDAAWTQLTTPVSSFGGPGTYLLRAALLGAPTTPELQLGITVAEVPPPQAELIAPERASSGCGAQLDATGSSDPAGNDLAFTWSCAAAPGDDDASPAAADAARCGELANSTAAAELVIPGGLLGNGTYELAVTVARPGASTTATARLEMIDAVDPVVAIETPPAQVSPQEELSLAATIVVSELCAVPPWKSWWIASADGGGVNATLLSRSTSDASLLVSPPLPVPAGSYRLSLVLSASADASWLADPAAGVFAFASGAFEVDAPPEGGSCRVYPEAGSSVSTEFLLSSLDWVDDDLPLLHRFSWAAAGGSAWEYLVAWTQDQHFSHLIFFEAGVHAIRAEAKDTLGSSANALGTVTVVALTAGKSDGELLDVLSAIVVAGNRFSTVAAITAVAEASSSGDPAFASSLLGTLNGSVGLGDPTPESVALASSAIARVVAGAMRGNASIDVPFASQATGSVAGVANGAAEQSEGLAVDSGSTLVGVLGTLINSVAELTDEPSRELRIEIGEAAAAVGDATQTGLAEGETAFLQEGAWILGAPYASCAEACTAAGMECSEASLWGQRAAVDSDAEVAGLVAGLGSSCVSFGDGSLTEGWPSAAPLVNGSGECIASPAGRALDTFSCSAAASAQDRRRLCWCHEAGVGMSVTVTKESLEVAVANGTVTGQFQLPSEVFSSVLAGRRLDACADATVAVQAVEWSANPLAHAGTVSTATNAAVLAALQAASLPVTLEGVSCCTVASETVQTCSVSACGETLQSRSLVEPLELSVWMPVAAGTPTLEEFRLCQWFNESASAWSDEGCVVTAATDDRISCACSHFASSFVGAYGTLTSSSSFVVSESGEVISAGLSSLFAGTWWRERAASALWAALLAHATVAAAAWAAARRGRNHFVWSTGVPQKKRRREAPWFVVTEDEVTVWESAKSWVEVRTLAEGDIVKGAGKAVTVGEYIMQPIAPDGAVQLAFLRPHVRDRVRGVDPREVRELADRLGRGRLVPLLWWVLTEVLAIEVDPEWALDGKRAARTFSEAFALKCVQLSVSTTVGVSDRDLHLLLEGTLLRTDPEARAAGDKTVSSPSSRRLEVTSPKQGSKASTKFRKNIDKEIDGFAQGDIGDAWIDVVFEMFWTFLKAVHPAWQLALFSVEMPWNYRVAFLLDWVFGPPALSAVVLSRSACTDGESCPGGSAWDHASSDALVSVLCAALGFVPVFALVTVHSRRAREAAQAVQGPKRSSSLLAGLGYFCICTMLLVIFLANVSTVDADRWLVSAGVHLVVVWLLVPFLLALMWVAVACLVAQRPVLMREIQCVLKGKRPAGTISPSKGGENSAPSTPSGPSSPASFQAWAEKFENSPRLAAAARAVARCFPSIPPLSPLKPSSVIVSDRPRPVLADSLRAAAEPEDCPLPPPPPPEGTVGPWSPPRREAWSPQSEGKPRATPALGDGVRPLSNPVSDHFLEWASSIAPDSEGGLPGLVPIDVAALTACSTMTSPIQTFDSVEQATASSPPPPPAARPQGGSFPPLAPPATGALQQPQPAPALFRRSPRWWGHAVAETVAENVAASAPSPSTASRRQLMDEDPKYHLFVDNLMMPRGSPATPAPSGSPPAALAALPPPPPLGRAARSGSEEDLVQAFLGSGRQRGSNQINAVQELPTSPGSAAPPRSAGRGPAAPDTPGPAARGHHASDLDVTEASHSEDDGQPAPRQPPSPPQQPPRRPVPRELSRTGSADSRQLWSLQEHDE